MNDDLTGMFRELKEIEAAISQSREMVEVIQKHLNILPPEFLRDVQKVIAPLDVKEPRCPVYGEARGTADCEVCGGYIVNCPVYGPGERKRLAEEERERDQP